MSEVVVEVGGAVSGHRGLGVPVHCNGRKVEACLPSPVALPGLSHFESVGDHGLLKGSESLTVIDFGFRLPCCDAEDPLRAGLGVPVPVGSCRLLAPQAAQGSVLPLPQFWSQPFLQGARVPFWGAASGNRGLGTARASLLPVSSSLGPPVAEPGSGFQSPSPHATGVPVSLQRCL